MSQAADIFARERPYRRRTLRRAGIGRLGYWALRIHAWSVFGFLLLPLAVLITSSFAGQSYVVFPPREFSLDGYTTFFTDAAFLYSLLLSFELAASASVIASVIGFLAAYVLVRRRFRGREFLSGFFLSPLILPQIIVGVALLQLFTLLGLATSFIGLLIAHVVSVIPYVIRTVGAALQRIDPRVEEAAADLGAGPLETLALVVLPMVRGGAVAGALFAFIMSWINVEISIFLGATGTYTLPVLLYNYMEYSITTAVVAAACIGIYVAVALVIVIDRVIGLDTATKL
jgi:putative spermidine/putrescine transport system permease protein